MKKLLIVFLVTISLLSLVLASPPAPAPKCLIKGIIQSVEFKEAYNESCFNNCDRPGYAACCPTDMEYEHPDRYFLNVTIKEVSYIEGTTEFSTCEKLFPVNENKIIFINKANVKQGDQFISNQQIEGQTPPYWGVGYLESYTLEEPTNTNSKTLTYIIIAVIIILLLAILIYFLLRNKK